MSYPDSLAPKKCRSETNGTYLRLSISDVGRVRRAVCAVTRQACRQAHLYTAIVLLRNACRVTQTALTRPTLDCPHFCQACRQAGAPIKECFVLLRNAWWVTRKTLTHPTYAKQSAALHPITDRHRSDARPGIVPRRLRRLSVVQSGQYETGHRLHAPRGCWCGR